MASALVILGLGLGAVAAHKYLGPSPGSAQSGGQFSGKDYKDYINLGISGPLVSPDQRQSGNPVYFNPFPLNDGADFNEIRSQIISNYLTNDVYVPAFSKIEGIYVEGPGNNNNDNFNPVNINY